jgi:hypothetical protein
MTSTVERHRRVDYACRSCRGVLMDDPATWRSPPDDASASLLGPERVVTTSREVTVALREIFAAYPPGRLINQRRHGKLSRPGVVVVLENPDAADEQRLRFADHPACSRKPWSVKWTSLVDLANTARERGETRVWL